MYIGKFEVKSSSVRFDSGKNVYDITVFATEKYQAMASLELTPAALQSLVMQCLALMPSIEPRYAIPDIAEAHRRPARILLEFDDRSIQLLLRETQSDTLLDFLWYMADGVLIKRILDNMSGRAAEKLMDDLNENWFGKNPDTVLDVFAKRGQAAIAEIMSLCEKLIAEGQMPNFLENLIPEKKPDLTADEVDALLKPASGAEGKSA